jgi:YebC/PmpR family DNA-binding regulatory protein
MGRQWLQAKRLVAGLKKGRATSKFVREISVAAKIGGADPSLNPHLFASVEKAKKESVTKDVILRAINKGAGIGSEKMSMEHVVYEGRAPHNVPVIVEVYTDNVNRVAPEIRVLFKRGQLATTGSNKFLFDHVGLVEAHHPDANVDREAAAIEAGANEVEVLTSEENDDIPAGVAGAKFICERTAVHAVSQWLAANGWKVVTSEIGYVPKQYPELTEEQRNDVGEFLHALDEHDDVHRVWAAVK